MVWMLRWERAVWCWRFKVLNSKPPLTCLPHFSASDTSTFTSPSVLPWKYETYNEQWLKVSHLTCSALLTAPPRGRCNHKSSLMSPACPCLRFMLHPIKVSPDYIPCNRGRSNSLSQYIRPHQASNVTVAVITPRSILSKTRPKMPFVRNGSSKKRPRPENIRLLSVPIRSVKRSRRTPRSETMSGSWC
jgi:hypothetical protein